MPAVKNHNATLGIPSTKGVHAVKGLNEAPAIFEYPYAIRGVTLDSTGAPLGNCVVTLHRASDKSFVNQTTSDASGNYLLHASKDLSHYIVSYKTGAPDVAGTTVNTLVGE